MLSPLTSRQTIKSFKLKGDINQCPNCSLFFNSNGAFDKHRVGSHSDRRCLTEDEMQEKGMCLNYRDLYIAEQFTPEVKQRKINADQRNSSDLGLGG